MNALLGQLLAVKAKIATEDKWTQGAYARLPNGEVCHVSNPSAASFCLRGVCLALDDGTGSDILRPFLRKHSQNLFPSHHRSLTNLNDAEGFAAVHAVLDAAIAEARAQESA